MLYTILLSILILAIMIGVLCVKLYTGKQINIHVSCSNMKEINGETIDCVCNDKNTDKCPLYNEHHKNQSK